MSAIHKLEGDLTTAELAKILDKAGDTIDAHVSPVILNTAHKIEATQKERVAVRTGKTRDSIKVTGPGGAAFTEKTVEAEIGPTFFVGKLVELGTSTMAPRPFVGGSPDPHMAQHEKDMQAAALKALKGLT